MTSRNTEEGGGILHSNYTRDHLATAAHSARKWLVCGFNAFGQLDTAKDEEQIIQQFEEFTDNYQLLASSWSYLAAANGCSLHLKGFFCDHPKSVKTIKTGCIIKSLAVCDRFCLILLTDGRLYKCLPQDDQLEEVKFQGSQNPMSHHCSKFGTNTSDHTSRLKVDLIACGNNIMVAISNSNEVFTGTVQIHKFPKHIRPKQLVCGFEHALLLTSNGDVYSWGNGLRGQLGQDILRIEENPIIVEALAGIKITCITSSGWHSAAISSFGDLYTWGFNSNGQLGLKIYKNDACLMKEPAVYPLPQLVDLNCQCERKYSEQNCFPIKVQAGSRHTILIMNCGSLYATGWNLYGQLGLRRVSSYCDVFKYVRKLDSNKIDSIEIVCGSWCTLIGLLQE